MISLWMIIFISWTSVFMIVMIAIVLVAGKQIKLKWKALLGKKRDRGLVIEIKTNRSIREHFIKLNKDTLEIKNRVYNIRPEHVFMSDDWGCKAVIVSEALKSSINPTPTGTIEGMDSETITNLLKRAKSAGQQEALDFIQKISKMLPLVLFGLAIVSAIQIFLLIQITLMLKGSGLVI